MGLISSIFFSLKKVASRSEGGGGGAKNNIHVAIFSFLSYCSRLKTLEKLETQSESLF